MFQILGKVSKPKEDCFFEVDASQPPGSKTEGKMPNN
jgi:hypothetical protein